MTLRRLLAPLHGERPTPTQIYLIHVPAAGIAAGVAAGVAGWLPGGAGTGGADVTGAAATGLQIAAAFLLFWHLAAGFIAHMTRSVNDYYRDRPRGRVFVPALHLTHIILVALLFDAGNLYLFFSAVFPVAGALVLNTMYADDNQKPGAAVLVLVGLGVYAFVLPPPALIPWFGPLLLLKLLLGYAPDHYPPNDTRRWWA